ncbi:MAG: hypothetical protein Q9188_004327 [Gyalolechia gomerana]
MEAFTLVLPIFNPNAEVAGGFDISQLEDPRTLTVTSTRTTGLRFAAQRDNPAVAALNNKR